MFHISSSEGHIMDMLYIMATHSPGLSGKYLDIGSVCTMYIRTQAFGKYTGRVGSGRDQDKIGWEWAVYKRLAAWMLTHKSKQKQKKIDNHGHVELPPPPRQHGKSCFAAANVSERTTSTPSQLRFSGMY